MAAPKIAFFAVLAAASVLAATAAVAEPVRIQAAARGDFGRIVFSWNNPVSHTLTVKDGRLTVRFGRPMEATFGGVAQRLGKYVRSVSAGGDGQSVVFDLKGDFDVYSFDSGSAVIVEIADKEASEPNAPAGKAKTAEPAPLKRPEEKAEDQSGTNSGVASKPPVVRVRIGQHPDFTRIVFDWPRKVGYRFKRDGGVATLTFDRAARINLDAMQSRPPRYVGGARSRIGDGGVTVTFSVPATSRISHFLSGPKVVMDIRPPSGSDKAAPLPPEGPPSPAPAAKTAEAPPPAAIPKNPETAAPETAKIETKAVNKTGDKTGAGPAAAPAPPAAPPEAKADAETGTEIETKTETGETKTAAAGVAGAAESTSAPGKPTRLLPAGAGAGTTPKPEERGAVTPPPLPPRLSQVSITAAAGGSQAKASKPAADAVTLRFDWSQPVGAAVFRRAGFLWVAFDQPTAIDIGQLREAGKNFIKGIEQMGTATATVLRMATVDGINPSIRRDGQAWLLDFRKQPMDVQTPMEVKAQPESPVGARLFVPVPEPGNPIGVTDPEVGDNIVIVPLIPLGHGIGLDYLYPQVRFLPSIQGLVIQPLVDDIRVRPLREGVEVTSGGELYISPVSLEAEANRRLASLKPLTRILDLEPWTIKSINAFLPRKYELLAVISTSREAAREAARLDLARFYFANGFFAEVLAVLREVKRDRAGIDQDPEYRMLTGGAQFMMGRYGEASASLDLEELRLNDEASFWRAATSAVTGDITAAAPKIKRTGQIIRPYPKSLKIPLGALVTDTAIKIGDIRQARHFLEILRLDDLTPEEDNQLDYQEGRVLELSGDFDEAVAKWEKVIKGDHRPSRVKATVARMELLLKLNRITRKEAIKDLESLRFSWRGDEFEFSMLRRLGALYLEEGLYRKGLDRLRQAATYFRTHPEAPQVTLQMSDAFTELYLNDAADALAPITAIALYDEFKELTPAGAQGDEMIRKLADRLVGVDLLDRAVTLLDSQVRFRLKGVEKARVGTQLALVHILARDFKAALKVFSETDVPNMPEQLSAQRRHLQAKSLLGLKQGEQAIVILKDDKSRDAELLRTEIFWRARDWSKAAQSLRRLISETNAKPGKALDDNQASYVLNYAIALTLSGNERGLNRARSDFSAAMEKSNLKDAFKLIVSPVSLGLLDPARVTAGVREAENFQTFMAAYRERLKKQNLSDLVPGAGKPGAQAPVNRAGEEEQQAPVEPARTSPQV